MLPSHSAGRRPPCVGVVPAGIMDAAPLCEAGTDSGRTSPLGGVLDLSAPAPRRWYCLAKVLDGGGVAAATEEEADVVASKLKPEDVRECNSPALSLDALPPPGPDSPETSVHGAVVFRYVPASKQGGPCDHCATTESPQWRRGPAVKPVLCNACGTRYRRTGQLHQRSPASTPAPPPPRPSDLLVLSVKKQRLSVSLEECVLVRC